MSSRGLTFWRNSAQSNVRIGLHERRWVAWCLVLASLALGTAIYVLFGVRTLKVFGWATNFGLFPVIQALREHRMLIEFRAGHPQLVQWTLGHMPDGCWVFAWVVHFGSLKSTGCDAAVWMAVGWILAAASELGQLFGWVSGTFDVQDLAVYFMAACAGYCIAKTGKFAEMEDR